MAIRNSLATLALLLLGSACDSGVDAQVALVQLGNACRINSDCDALLVCTFQRCHEACVTSRDCHDQAHCVAGDQPRHVCQLVSEEACSAGHACPGTQVCGIDARCRDRCASNRDCLAEQTCSGGTCADSTELDDAGALSQDAGLELPAPCAYNSDCPGEQQCRAGVCRLECQADTDCPVGNQCTNHRCSAQFDAGSNCFLDSDCAKTERCADGKCEPLPALASCALNSDCPKSGQHCSDGACRCECAVDADCPSGQACPGGCACEPNRIVAGDVTVFDETQLAQLTDVVQVTGTLVLQGPSLPVTVTLPVLKTVTAFKLQNAFTVTALSLPQLAHAGSFTLSQDFALQKLSLPVFTTVGALSIAQTKLGDLSAFDPVQGAALKSAASLNFKGNSALSECAVSGLAADLPGFTGTVVNTGNNLCPVPCTGVVCQ